MHRGRVRAAELLAGSLSVLSTAFGGVDVEDNQLLPLLSHVSLALSWVRYFSQQKCGPEAVISQRTCEQELCSEFISNL